MIDKEEFQLWVGVILIYCADHIAAKVLGGTLVVLNGLLMFLRWRIEKSR